MTGTRWLSEDEQRVWRTYLEATQLLTQQLTTELDACGQGLSMAEYELLVRLSEAPSWSARMSGLADGLVHSRSRLTHTIARMEERGLVRRETCPGDRRGVLAVMTDQGFAVLAAAAPTHVTGVREHVFDQLDAEDVAALGRVLTRVADHLRPISAPPAPVGATAPPRGGSRASGP